jgi:hypothetical protein
MMLKRLSQICTLMALPIALCFAADVVTAVHGTVTKVDNATKTLVVKTKDGTEHTLHVVSKTTVSGTDAGAKDTFKGLKEGSEVVAHYTEKGSEKTAVEVDNVGKDGLKETEGTISTIDRGTKTIAVKTADGTVQTFKIADHATEDAGKDIAKGTEKTAKVTVYYTEEAGKKVAHWFEGK